MKNNLFDLDIYGQGHSDLVFICNTLSCLITYACKRCRHCAL